MQIAIAAPHEVDRIWPLIVDGVKRSCNRSFDPVPPGELFHMCRTGSAVLFIAHDEQPAVVGASIWQFRRSNERSVLQGLALCGRDMGAWFAPMRQSVRDFARANGAHALLDYGRPGLARLFERYGSTAKPVAVAFEEEL